MRKLTLRGMVALAVIVAIFVCVAGVSIGGDAPPSYPVSPAQPQTRSAGNAPVTTPPAPPTGNAPQLIINEVMPLGDNEHFGLTNLGTAELNLTDFRVSIDESRLVTLPCYKLKPGDEVNVVLAPEARANEADQA